MGLRRVNPQGQRLQAAQPLSPKSQFERRTSGSIRFEPSGHFDFERSLRQLLGVNDEEAWHNGFEHSLSLHPSLPSTACHNHA